MRILAYVVAIALGASVAGVWGILGGWLFVFFGFKIQANYSKESNADDSRELVLILMELAGKLASSDGYVSVEEISFTESAIRDLQETYDFTREEAIEHFSAGKQADYPINERLEVLNRYLEPQTSILCLQLLVRLAVADNDFSPNEIAFLRYVGRHLRVSADSLDEYLRQFQQHYSQYNDPHSAEGSNRSERESYTRYPNINQALVKAYNTLGVTPDSTNDEVQRSYRKLRSLYHPDKLVAKNIPQALIEEAERQIIEVNNAWDTIKQERQI